MESLQKCNQQYEEMVCSRVWFRNVQQNQNFPSKILTRQNQEEEEEEDNDDKDNDTHHSALNWEWMNCWLSEVYTSTKSVKMDI